MNKLSVSDVALAEKTVLVRVDFNVPLDGARITDDTRVTAALPTIKYIIGQQGKVVLMSHLGRPKGEPCPDLSLAPVAELLSKLLRKPVTLAPDCVGPEVTELVARMEPGDVILLENLRFHPEEEDNDPEFARQLAKLGDLYVNDAFGAVQRAHASTEGITHYFDARVAGFLMQSEVDRLTDLLENPERPFLAILGGAKVSDKIGVITKLLEVADELIIGGGMAYTFLKAQGRDVGESLVEKDKLSLAREILKHALDIQKPIYLPIDHVVADEFSPSAHRQIVIRHCIHEGWQGMDIGPSTVEKFRAVIQKAHTIFWNGPLGVFEFDEFARGTTAIARAIAQSRVISIIGGGDCVAAVQKAGVAEFMTHISTGGGASLEFIEGKPLPGIIALSDKE